MWINDYLSIDQCIDGTYIATYNGKPFKIKIDIEITSEYNEKQGIIFYTETTIQYIEPIPALIQENKIKINKIILDVLKENITTAYQGII